MHILIVHGPNLNLLGEAKGDPLSYVELNQRLQAFAKDLGARITLFQSNHEGELIDAIQSHRHSVDAILINPGAFTHYSYALRECLRIVGKPTIEVHLVDIRRRETWRRRSVIKDVCEAQVMGKGLLSYLDALERLVTGKYSGVRKGRSKSASEQPSPVKAAPEKPRQAVPVKTIGRAIANADAISLLQQAAQSAAPPAKVALAEPSRRSGEQAAVTRDAVRDHIFALLGHKISPATLATWAREQWLNVERGAATEMGQRELLSEALQSLALSATPAGRLSDDELVELMTRLE